MTTPQITIHDANTGEIITRAMNSVEIALLAADQARAAQSVKTEKELAETRQTILDRLGLTNEEFQTLIG